MSWQFSVKVAVALIIDDEQRILITQRPLHVPHGGCWEFPGGKLEANESAEQALIREIKEEIGIDVHQFQLVGEVNHHYTNKSVTLIVFYVSQFTGVPQCLEGQLNLKWEKIDKLNSDHFPEANKALFDLIPVLAS